MLKRVSVLIATVLAVCIALFPAAAFAEDDGWIHIRTAQDLMELAMECSLDTWSDGKKIVLDDDLSVSEVDFESIPIFNGEFDGGGHTIYDLALDSAQSPCGFFLETGEKANIYNLNISGSVASRGDDSMVGGIVGRNRGLLTNCCFSGEVYARSQVGGIVGKNEAVGVITGCTASGSVRGLSQTGGIVGENAGAVVSCENRSFVNTESVDPTLRLDAIDTSSILNFIRSLRADNAGITTDTGGIAGNSTGFIEHCSNSGTVGYLHLGYNVGGVAGHSSGYINGCGNSADVYGRKDVGGIVGQAEPLIATIEAENLLAGVAYRIYALNEALNDAVADAQYASELLAGNFENMASMIFPIADAIRSIDITDPESVWWLHDAISGCVEGVTNEVYAVGTGINWQSGILLDDLNAINENLNALSGTAIQAVNQLAGRNDSTENILVDESDSLEGEQLTFGKTAACDNSGAIYGDSNVGGIVGGLSVESDVDPEGDMGILGNLGGGTLNRDQISVNCVVTGCVNRGSVTAKRECAGGVAGKTDFGLVSHCASYGPVALEDGDYAGGVCGLCYGSVKSCCAKCSLSGKRYIGGVVGNGYAGRGDEKASLVSGCYTLVEILDSPQFAGAVSGGGAGTYENNFFVPANYAGLDRLSIHGQAEPISFEDFTAVDSLPDACKTFTLRFVVDGAVVKELSFDYGASFDRSVFPSVERRDGAYAVWDRSDLRDLRFDTTVTAVYRMDETVLRSEVNRDDGRAVLYVDGQFQQGDALELTMIPVEEEDVRSFSASWQDTVREQLRSIFREGSPDYSIPVSVTERLRVRFPDDGLQTHSLRYLTPDGGTENYRLYLAGEDGWQRIRPQVFGSYYLFEVPGDSAEIALVATIQSWWIVAYIAAGLLILVLLIAAIVKLRRLLRARPKKERTPFSQRPFPRWLNAHRKPVLIAAPILLIAAGALAVSLYFGSVGSALSAYRIIKDFSQKESDVQTEIRVRTDAREVEMSTVVHRVQQDGHMIRCTEQYGIPLYISDGMVFLENGRAFRLADGQLSQGKVLDLALDVFLHEEVQKTVEGNSIRFDAVIGGETADHILKLFLSASEDELLRAGSMNVSLCAENGSLRNLSFSGDGAAASGAPFSFRVTLTPQPMPARPVIPRAVLRAIEDGGEDTLVLSEDLLRLLAAWIKNESAESVNADIAVVADCGSVNLSPRYRYFRTAVQGTDVHCVKSALFTLYFTDGAACTSTGADLSEAQQRVLAAAQLFPIAREFCLKGQFSCASAGERSVYTVTLSSEDAADVVSRLLPELDRLNVSYDDCRLRIFVVSGALDTVELSCGGSVRVVAKDMDASVLVSAHFTGSSAETVPSRVKKALLG